jgi:hypothetical protein
LDKPYGQCMALAGHFWPGKHRRAAKGINLVALCCADPQGKRQPVNFRAADKAEGKTKNGCFQDMLAEVPAWGLSRPLWPGTVGAAAPSHKRLAQRRTNRAF